MESMTTESKHAAGELLKQGRLRQRLSIAECSKRTHIAQRYLEALEDERWETLPSESHRLGFLRLYSRFLGVSAEEVLNLYRQKTSPKPVEKPAAPVEVKDRRDSSRHIRTPAPESSWSPSTSVPQIIGLGVLLLVLAWVMYHAVSPRLLEQNQILWTQQRRSSPSQSRISATKAIARLQKMREIDSSADRF